MATENANNTDKKDSTKKIEDYIGNIITHPLTTFGAGILGGYLLGTHVGNKKVERLEEQYALQMAKRDEQFGKLIEQMSIANSRQEQFIKAFAAYSGQEIEDMEEDPEDKVFKSRNSYKYGKRKFAKI